MVNTKNHRRNNKKRQTKKYKRGGGFYEDAAKDSFEEWDADNSETLNKTEYNNIKTQRMPYLPDFDDVAGDDNEVDLNEFTAAFIFTSFAQAKKLSVNNYKNLQESLPDKFDSVEYGQVDKDGNGIDFKEFLTAYNNAKQSGGRRRRKRSTRNKRKTNKKRRTVKRRKSAKKSHRRK